MDKKIVIFTSSELRHDAFRIFLSNEKGIKIVKAKLKATNPFHQIFMMIFSILDHKDSMV